MNSKRAQGHIEIISSFLIFIGFLLFMFIFLNPFATSESKDIVNNIERSILNNISEDVGKLSVIVDEGKCYDPLDFDLYKKTGQNIKLISSGRKYTIYYGNFFIPDVPSCTGEVSYTLGTYSTENMIIYEKIIELRTSYDNNYEDLKTSLGIIDEFIFELKRIDGGVEIGVNKEVPFGIEAPAADIPIRVINSNGVVSEFILNIRVW